MIPLIFNQFQPIHKYNTGSQVSLLLSFLLISIKTWVLSSTPEADSYLTTLIYFGKEKVKFMPLITSWVPSCIQESHLQLHLQIYKGTNIHYAIIHAQKTPPNSSEREIPDVYHTSGNVSCSLHMLTRNRIIITPQKYGSQNSLNIYVHLDKAFALALGLSLRTCWAPAVTGKG